MTTQVAQPRQLQPVTVEELLQDQEDGLDPIYWRLVGPGQNPGPEEGWVASQVPGQYTVGQLCHLMTITYEREVASARRRMPGAGLEFKVPTREGRCAIIASADEVAYVFRVCRMPPANGLVRRPRLPVGLSDAMRLQSERQAGLDTAML